MPALDSLRHLTISLPLSSSPYALWAYFGLGPGQELIPYFLTLLAFAGAALAAVLQWPLLVLRRFLSKRHPDAKPEPPGAPPTPSPTDDAGHAQ